MVANILRTTTLGAVQNIQQDNQAIDNVLASATHATRCAVSRALEVSPEALIFQWDMFFNLPIIADLITIRDKRQVMINENLRRQNLKCREWNYMVGQDVLIKEVDPNKLQPRAHGPCTIVSSIHKWNHGVIIWA
eukprot:873264-Ditylum_brightwellii.AAC.1